jgi:hypothetical protein
MAAGFDWFDLTGFASFNECLAKRNMQRFSESTPVRASNLLRQLLCQFSKICSDLKSQWMAFHRDQLSRFVTVWSYDREKPKCEMVSNKVSTHPVAGNLHSNLSKKKSWKSSVHETVVRSESLPVFCSLSSNLGSESEWETQDLWECRSTDLTFAKTLSHMSASWMEIIERQKKWANTGIMGLIRVSYGEARETMPNSCCTDLVFTQKEWAIIHPSQSTTSGGIAALDCFGTWLWQLLLGWYSERVCKKSWASVAVLALSRRRWERMNHQRYGVSRKSCR